MGVSNLEVPGAGVEELGVATKTSDQTGITTQVDITGLTLTMTLLTGRRYRTSLKGEVYSTAADGAFVFVITDASNTQLTRITGPGTTASYSVYGYYEENGAGVSVTRKARGSKAGGTGSVAFGASASYPAYLSIEDIGPAI